MSSPLMILLVLVPMILGIGILIWAVRFGNRRRRQLRFDEAAYPGLVRLRAATLRSRWIGLGLGGLALVLVFPLGRMSQLALAGPPVAGIVAITAILVGQRIARGAAQQAGSASIERRGPGDYLPSGLGISVLVALALLAATAGFTTAVAAPDARGVAGRALSGDWVEEVFENGAYLTIPMSETRSPFPGSFYTIPMAIALLALLLMAGIALVAIAARPRNGADPELVRVDDALRRITAEGVVAATGLAIGLDLAGVSNLSYLQFGQLPQVPWYVAACYGLGAIALAALVYSLRCLITVIVPGNGEA